MSCGCNRRARAASAGQVIQGYRIQLPSGEIVPAKDKAPFMSVAEARAAIRQHGGGTAFTETRESRVTPPSGAPVTAMRSVEVPALH